MNLLNAPCLAVAALLAGLQSSLPQPALAAAEPVRHRFLCVDNGRNQLIHVDQFQPGKSWATPVPEGPRDLQILTGAGQKERVLLSHGKGATEYNLATGQPSGWTVDRYSGIQSAIRLPNGRTLLARVDGTVFEVASDGKELGVIQPKAKVDIRLIRPLDNGNLLLSGAGVQALLEMKRDGEIVRRVPLSSKGYKAIQLPNGHYRSSAGDDCKLVELDATGRVVSFVGGKTEHPGLGLDFASGWDSLPNGNLVMCNWLGHGKQGTGCHLAEFTPDNRVVWTWQDHALARQVTNVKMLQ